MKTHKKLQNKHQAANEDRIESRLNRQRKKAFNQIRQREDDLPFFASSTAHQSLFKSQSFLRDLQEDSNDDIMF